MPASEDFCRKCAKVELHAHLNGSVRRATLLELADGVPARDIGRLTAKGARTLGECFQVFALIHQVVNSLAAIDRITTEMCEDMAADNVLYAEIRTTPKIIQDQGITKQGYIETVLKAIARSNARSSNATGKACRHARNATLDVKLLLSINRGEDAQAALDTVDLAIEFRKQGVVGVDLSGNPSIGSWETWAPALRRAKAAGLGVTLHIGEVPNDDEVQQMLALQPDRLGHMCCASEENMQRLLELRIPLELCLTSNVVTESVAGYSGHHFQKLWALRHPVVLCTDDPSVFCTTLSQELSIAASTFDLSEADLKSISLTAAGAAFLPHDAKRQLCERLETAHQSCSCATGSDHS